MERKRRLLQDYQEDIVRDLNIKDIIDNLFGKEAINGHEYDLILKIGDRVEGVRELLRILQSKPLKSIEFFVDSLAKDYGWLYEKLNLNKMNDSTLNESSEDCLSRGDVPRLPDCYVKRTALEKNVSSKLMDLARHKILALHGMPGCGKTIVAIGALRHNPELILNNFNRVVFWLNLANVKTDDDIMSQQIKLYRKTSQYRNIESSFMNSSMSMLSIASNNDSQSLSSTDWTWTDLRDKLKTVFEEPNLKDGLLVLDEVNEKRFVDAFDIGCKILITTRDTDVVANLQPQIIKIVSNFEEEETLKLFASCLDVDVANLPFPSKAKKLHAICKGLNPFLIALIGAQFAENRAWLLDDSKRWDYYIKKLSKNDFMSILGIGSELKMKPIEMCINSLKGEILPLFRKLAVLPDNVKVSAKVIRVLWSEDIHTVEKIMQQLRSKSLVNETYVPEQKNYVYDIHDLIMNYLRQSHTSTELTKLHTVFLKNYGFDDVCDLPVELPDDKYIAFYIGYHLDQSKCHNSVLIFNKLFLNLKFLGNKVRLTGAADVMMDLEKYGGAICKHEVDKELILQIKNYLNKHGNDLYRYPATDIIQSILQYEKGGALYQRAYEDAQDGCRKRQLYFEFLHERNVDDTEKIQCSKEIHVKQDLTSICFLNDFILVGTLQGAVKIYEIVTCTLKKELTNSTHPIKCLSICPQQPFKVAALNSKGELHLWYLDDLYADNYDHTIEEEHETASSDCEENGYNNSLSGDHVCITPVVGPYLGFSWSNNNGSFIAHTANVAIMNDENGVQSHVIDIFSKETKMSHCIFSHDDNFVIAGYTLNGSFYVSVIDYKKNKKLATFNEIGPILGVISVPVNTSSTHCILVISEAVVLRHEWNMFKKQFNMDKSENIISATNIKENVKFVSAVLNKSGTVLFVSTNDSRIICVDLNTKEYIDFDNKRGDVVSMAVSEYDPEEYIPDYSILATGTGGGENSVKIYGFNPVFVNQVTKKHRKVRLTPCFDVSFTSPTSPKISYECDTPPSEQQSLSSTPKRHQSFMTTREQKPLAKKTLSLDRHSLKSLNLKGISNGSDECGLQPLLAVVDDRNNIQVLRGHELLTEISLTPDCEVTVVRISPCNQYIVYGLHSGTVNRFTIRTKETKVLMDVYSRVQYLNYIHSNLLIVFGKNRCMMGYKFDNGEWKLEMLQKGDCHLGSEEVLNDIQGNKKKMDSISSSGSETSINSKDRRPYPRGRLNNGGCLVHCFWVEGIGILSVEDNATVKLWNNDLKLITVLIGRQSGVCINCAAFQKDILVICDDYGMFQIFELRTSSSSYSFRTIQDKNNKLNNKITSCDLTKDGKILAMGLDSGAVVLWNVPAKTQLVFLKYSKILSPVQACLFSPVPNKLLKSAAQSPIVNNTFNYPNNNDHSQDDEAPLVLVTMASEIFWWDVSYLIKMRSSKRPHLRNRHRNVILSPLATPIENRTDLTSSLESLDLNRSNFFFGNGYFKTDSWENLWKRKTYKEGSEKKELLACIKISGMNARKLRVDDKFSCFVTVDNSGHIHIMNVMKTVNS